MRQDTVNFTVCLTRVSPACVTVPRRRQAFLSGEDTGWKGPSGGPGRHRCWVDSHGHYDLLLRKGWEH